ncbi:signal peptide peptidase SppA [Segatella copri]|uniref:Signal peptide peptidase SppA n=1 Tax=Segatella copri TaxID=165179 RepID=A0AAW4N7R6_9BACT|nr:signal peptide peptidase SppA [Segatella copri]MBV3388318.1 signal peptide peptidase SppA [Segatella copri]MBV3396126.1 signal peptide peptidase SppA [Segatella copri]MBV3405778.1 signal peptide peptidase SppA [Segatella copri]
MKDFFKNVAATIVGLFAFGLIMTILGFICIIGMIASSNSKPTLKDNAVMVLKLQGQIEDRSEDNWLGELTGEQFNNLGMNKILSSIRKAKDEEKVKGIYLETGILESDYATLQEIRNALADFKKSGKWIIAYGDALSQGGYYLASVANKVYVNPEGNVDWHGIASQPQYIKDVAAKFGVHFTVVKVGKYKSYTETYTEDKMSDANREQVSRYISGLWQQMLADVSKSRNISKDSLNRYADGLMVFDDAQLLKSRKMVDGFCYYDEIRDVVKRQLGLKTDETINQVDYNDVDMAIDDSNLMGEEIAVYYCQGSIVRMETPSIYGSEQQIVSTKVIKDLQELADNSQVKAVVLRINSGGGDAYASEQIWRAVKELNKKKPVVVSMGGMAASGAYYMSMGAQYIMAQPTTLTGSIGIFGALPDFSDLMTKKLGFKYDEVKTNRNSAYASAGMSRPWSAEEITTMQNYVNRGYNLFRKRVAEGRKMSTEQVEKIAQGRVWLGTDAKNIKLIDGFGGLSDAIDKAAELAHLSSYQAVEYPALAGWMEQLMDMAGGNKGTYLDEQLRLALGDLYQPFIMIRNMKEKEPIQAALPYVLNIQ